MLIINREMLHAYMTGNAPSRKPLARWIKITEAAKWENPIDVKSMFPATDFIGGNKAVFDIGENNYMLVVIVVYVEGIVNVQWIGTHKEYSKRGFKE